MYAFITRNKSRIEAIEEDNKSESDISEAKSAEHPGSEVTKTVQCYTEYSAQSVMYFYLVQFVVQCSTIFIFCIL